MPTVSWVARTRSWAVSRHLTPLLQLMTDRFSLSPHLSDDLHEAKSVINELNRRLHELELELRRLENERDELTAAYKEAEAVSSARSAQVVP